jgi:hypothetical protein
MKYAFFFFSFLPHMCQLSQLHYYCRLYREMSPPPRMESRISMEAEHSIGIGK